MPQPGPQSLAIRKHLVTELFFGGAVGGGKSDFLLGDFAQDVPQSWGPWCRGILFRRTYGELEELIQRSQEIYPQWFAGAPPKWSGDNKTWTWPNGATLKMRYLEHTTDWMRYWGHQYTWIGWDELPSWPDLTAYKKMLARLRSAHAVPNKRVRSTGNPGGPGHQAVKAYFGIDQNPHGGEIRTDPDTGMSRMFVKSKLHDNRILLQNDPAYADRLRGLGSDALIKAWLEGDWSVVTGAYFDCWSTDKHVIKPFDIPEWWLKFRAFDWGSARPFSVGWWAISDGGLLPDGRQYPAGAMVRYREWYGAKGPNEGLHFECETIAEGITKRSRNESYAYSVADPACFSKTQAGGTSGPSIAERMHKKGVTFNRGDNQRIIGWDQLRGRLLGADGPMIYCFDNCTDSIRTIPALQHDELKPEDLDTDAEDHAADEWRYAAMSRPWTRPAPAALKPYDFKNQVIRNLVGDPTQKSPRGTVRA